MKSEFPFFFSISIRSLSVSCNRNEHKYVIAIATLIGGLEVFVSGIALYWPI